MSLRSEAYHHLQPAAAGAIMSRSQFAAVVTVFSRTLPEARMKVLFGLAIGLLATQLGAQTASDETAIRGIVQDEIAAWNQGDAVAYSRHFAADGTFTNITGQFFTGYDAFLKQHEVIFEGRFKQTRLQQDIVSLKFVRPDVAVVEVLTSVTGVVAAQLASGTGGDPRGVCERGCCKLSRNRARNGRSSHITTWT